MAHNSAQVIKTSSKIKCPRESGRTSLRSLMNMLIAMTKNSSRKISSSRLSRVNALESIIALSMERCMTNSTNNLIAGKI